MNSSLKKIGSTKSIQVYFFNIPSNLSIKKPVFRKYKLVFHIKKPFIKNICSVNLCCSSPVFMTFVMQLYKRQYEHYRTHVYKWQLILHLNAHAQWDHFLKKRCANMRPSRMRRLGWKIQQNYLHKLKAALFATPDDHTQMFSNIA